MRMKSLLLSTPLTLLLASASSTAVTPPLVLDRLFGDDQGEVRATLLMRDGAVMSKRYAPGYSDANRFISWSMAKSVTAVLVGELVADGKLSLDTPIPFAEWQKPGDPRATITLRQMLHMETGISHSEVGEPVHNSDTNQALFVQATGGAAAYELAKPLEARPGAKYEYNSLTSLLLSELITRTLTNSTDAIVRANAYKAFAEERLFKPAGITSAVFDFDGAGTQIGGSIIYMTLDDWGRLGQLLLEGKGADGSEAITPDWLTFMRTPAPTNANYGGQIWLNRIGNPGSDQVLFPGTGPSSLFSAVGHLGQWVIVSPEQRLVLVRLGKTQDDKLGPVNTALSKVVASIPESK
jgi:CubicO group peptidase (beta-lactamase class C family)